MITLIKKYYLFISLLGVVSCDSSTNTNNELEQRAQGEWTWVQSSGAWVNYTPEKLGGYYMLSIRENNVSWYRNDTLQFSGNCTFEYKDLTSSGIKYHIISLYPERDSVLNNIFPLSGFLVYYVEIKDDSLLLNPYCNGVNDGDCYNSILVR